MALYALEIQYITGVTSFSVEPGFFYRVDTSAHNVTAQLPTAASVPAGGWNIIKNITGDNNVNVTPAAGENVNGGSGASQLTGNNQSHQYMPGTPAAYGTGWMSW